MTGDSPSDRMETMTDYSKTCFITGRSLGENPRWTDEFDAWVSVEGQQIVERDARGDTPGEESRIIFAEWYAKDEANAANDEYRRWHK